MYSKENKNISGVPDYISTEFHEKKTKYCLCIPIINEAERIHLQLERAKKSGVDQLVDIIICDGDSKDGSTELSKMEALGVNTLLVKKGFGKQGAQLRMGFWFALERGYEGVLTIDGNNKDSIESVSLFIEKL
ncbi:MAG: glycosyl transferase family 2, partial [Flavobacterium sp.]|nr:glycosyl transferase family 2 [Flavobacterium sp.]